MAEHEVHNLRKLCDEVFGEENFIIQICHKSRASISNYKIISSSHNFILLYAKSYAKIFSEKSKFGLPPVIKGFNHKDDFGEYKLLPVDGPVGAAKSNPYYTFEGVEGYWRYSKKTMQEKYEQNLIVKTANGLQQKYYKGKAL